MTGKKDPEVHLPPLDPRHDMENVRGLLLAVSLKPESVALLLGIGDVHLARAYQGNAAGRLAAIKNRISIARNTP